MKELKEKLFLKLKDEFNSEETVLFSGQSLKMRKIEVPGDFIVAGKIVVADPCYVNDSLKTVIDVVPGTWHSRVERDKDGYITRAEVFLRPVQKFITMGKVVPVDSGQVGFFDEKELLETLEREKDVSIYSTSFYKACCALTTRDERCGLLEKTAFLSATGGDGGHLLECALDDDRRVIALALSFL